MDTYNRLEVEDEDERQKRLGQLLMKVDQTRHNTLNTAVSSAVPPINPVEAPIPAPIEPPVELLNRVQRFLPQLAESNASLSNRDQHELDIENINADGSYYIEMNLGLGVFEGARSGEGSSASSSSPSSSMSECDSEGSDNNSSGSSSCSEPVAQAAARPKKPLPRRARPSITILGESENRSGGSPA